MRDQEVTALDMAESRGGWTGGRWPAAKNRSRRCQGENHASERGLHLDLDLDLLDAAAHSDRDGDNAATDSGSRGI
jgi:hypothetical protein